LPTWRVHPEPPLPPDQAQPVPIYVIRHAANIAQQHGTPELLAVISMLCIAFFFLCRPGEYTAPTTNNASFPLKDVTIYVSPHCILTQFATEANLD
jgi:hypothetical protein